MKNGDLPHVRRYRDATFVIKVGGELLDDPSVLDRLVLDIARLRQLQVGVVVVHGGGPQLSRWSDRCRIERLQVAGRRVTDDETLELAKMVFAGLISTNILAAFRRRGVPSIGLSGVAGNLVLARRRPPQRIRDVRTGEERVVDFKNVGDIKNIDGTYLRLCLEWGLVAVVASLASDAEGQVLNVNADTMAAAIAIALDARKLVLLSNVDGVFADTADRSSLLPVLTIERARELIASGKAGGGMAPKLDAAVQAVEGGVGSVHIANGLRPGALVGEALEIQKSGTILRQANEDPPNSPWQKSDGSRARVLRGGDEARGGTDAVSS